MQKILMKIFIGKRKFDVRDKCAKPRLLPECKVCIGMSRSLFGSVLGEHRCLDCHEVLHQQVSLGILGQSSYSCLDAELYGAHESVGLDLLVGHQPGLVDPPVADLPVAFTDRIVLGVARPCPCSCSCSSWSPSLRASIIEGAMLVL